MGWNKFQEWGFGTRMRVEPEIEISDDGERRGSIATDPLDFRSNTKLMQDDRIA